MIYKSGKPVLEPIEIEHDVPLPSGRLSSPTNDAARDMRVGDSILVPYSRKPIAGNMERATGFKFTQRREGNNLRIWRIK